MTLRTGYHANSRLISPHQLVGRVSCQHRSAGHGVDWFEGRLNLDQAMRHARICGSPLSELPGCPDTGFNPPELNIQWDFPKVFIFDGLTMLSFSFLIDHCGRERELSHAEWRVLWTFAPGAVDANIVARSIRRQATLTNTDQRCPGIRQRRSATNRIHRIY